MNFTIEKFESKKDENQTIAYCRLFKKKKTYFTDELSLGHNDYWDTDLGWQRDPKN